MWLSIPLREICTLLIVWLVIAGDDIWRYVGKLTDAQKSMIDDRFKWKVSSKYERFFCFSLVFVSFVFIISPASDQGNGEKKRRDTWGGTSSIKAFC